MVERKAKIKRIYPGYRMQLFAQYFCLQEMGHPVSAMCLHSLEDNKRYPVDLPDHKDQQMFADLVWKVKHFQVTDIQHQNLGDFRETIYQNLYF